MSEWNAFEESKPEEVIEHQQVPTLCEATTMIGNKTIGCRRIQHYDGTEHEVYINDEETGGVVKVSWL